MSRKSSGSSAGSRLRVLTETYLTPVRIGKDIVYIGVANGAVITLMDTQPADRLRSKVAAGSRFKLVTAKV